MYLYEDKKTQEDNVMFTNFNFQQILSAFIVLFAVIDIIGAIPIIIDLKDKGKDVNALKATLISFLLLLVFFYAGDILLKLFHVDIESFAVAGAFVIFLLSLEMILDIEIFKNQGPIKEATLVPLVFPFASRSRIVHHFVVAPCGICQREYYRGVNTEYAMGIFRGSYDTEGGKDFRERWYLLDP